MAQQPGQQHGCKAVHALLLTLAVLARPAAGEEISVVWVNSLRFSSLMQLAALPANISSYCAANCGYDAGFSQGRGDWRSELRVAQGNQVLTLGFDARKELVQSEASFVEPGETYLEQQFDGPAGRLSVTLGRHTLLWGETRLFPANAIAGAMAPIDSSLDHGNGGYDGTSHFLPVAQVTARWQLLPSWTLLAYQQGEWRRNRSDAYDPNNPSGDLLGSDGNYQIRFTPPRGGGALFERADASVPNGRGQFGIGLRGQLGALDVGLYGLRFDAKSPTLAYDIPDRLYHLGYARGIDLAGVSLAAPLGDITLSMELSGRHRQPLVNGGLLTTNSAALGPRGDMAQGQIGLSGVLAPGEFWPGGGDWVVELAGNRLIKATDDEANLAAGRTGSAAALRGRVTSQYFQLWPRIDLSLPLSLGYNFYGRSAELAAMTQGSGEVGLGVTLSFDQRWSLGVTLTHYFGRYHVPLAPQPGSAPALSRWDNAGMSLQTSF